MVNVTRNYVKVHAPSVSVGKKERHQKFQQMNKPTKGEGIGVSLLLEHSGAPTCSSLPCRLTDVPLENRISGPGHQIEPCALILGLWRETAPFPIDIDFSLENSI